jgi:hypothetical protein
MTKFDVRKQVAVAVVGLTALGYVCAGAANADPGQDTMTKFTELTEKAEHLAATMNSAQHDFDQKLQLLGQADQTRADDQARLDAARARLAGYQSAADDIAAAAYMGGHGYSILTAASPQSLIDDLAIQRTMATQIAVQMQNYRRLDREARAMAAASERSTADAKAAVDAAAAVRSELQIQQSRLQTEVSAAKAEFAMLPPSEQAVLNVMPPSVVAALGPIRPIPTVGMGGLVPNARGLAAYIMATYPGVRSIGGVRSDPLPDHPSGHAIDIMLDDMALGDIIHADIQRQAGRFGVVYTMWRVAAHFDHIHITVS